MWTSNGRTPRGNSKRQNKRDRVPPPPPPPPPGGYRVLILVGIPGSGKSTFASFLEDFGWTVVNQDTLGSREKCRVKAQQVLRKGGRVVVDRCNFDQSQRVTWIDLAVSLSLHQDACIAVWLDIPVDICRDRVQRRVGHPTLGPGRIAEGVVKRVAGDLRPPHRKEGFHTVLRCKTDQDLSEAVAVLSSTATAGASRGGGDRGHRPVPNTTQRAQSAPAPGAMGSASGGGGGWGGGGHGRGDAGGAENVGTSWGSSRTSFPPKPASERGGIAGGDDALLTWGGHNLSGGTAANSGGYPVDGRFVSVNTNAGMPGGARLSEAGAGQGFPVGAVHQEGDYGNGPVLAWGGEQPQAGGGGYDALIDWTGGGVNNNNSDATAMNASASYPSLPGGRHPGNRNTTRRFTGSISEQNRPVAKASYGSSSLSTIAKLTPQAQTAAASAGLPRQQQPTAGARQLRPAEISASFSDLQAPPRVLAPEDVGQAATSAPSSRSRATGATKENNKKSPTAQSAMLPLGPSNLEEWTSRLEGTETAAAGSVPSDDDSSDDSASWQTAEPGGYTFGDGADAGSGGEGPEGGRRLSISDGEAFFVLEDMFGGLLPPDALEKVFLESRNDLHKAMKKGFQLCEDLWGRGDDLVSPVSPLSDTTTTDALLAPSTTTSTDSSSTGNRNDLWDDDSQGELVDVSEWTHEQIDTLSELCLAFEGTFPRETVIAALTASDHDPTSAAQLLLDPSPRARRKEAGWGRGKGGRGRKKNGWHGKGRGAPQRERKIQSKVGGVATTAAGLSAASLLGTTCGADNRAYGGRTEEDGDGGEAGEEEEEGDEGLSSEEYRAIANDAAEAMKAWFQKAAEAFTRGGRNGGAAAADPSHIGQRWKKKMEAANLRAARQCFRERNPLIRVGRTSDGVSVLKVLTLPRPSQCTIPGQLSVDLHLLRRAEALNVLEAVLHALRRREQAVTHGRILRHRPPRAATSSQEQREAPFGVVAGADQRSAAALDYPESFAAATCTATAFGDTTPPSAMREVVHGAGHAEGDQNGSCVIGVGTFWSLELVVGRGAHSVAGVPRLRPCVVGYLAGKGFRAEAVELHKGQGAIVVGLG